MKPLAIVIASVSLILSTGAAQAEGFPFSAKASGAQEVTDPPGGVLTATRAEVKVDFDADLSAAAFELDIFNGFGITMAHLHCAPAGLNGPIAAFLFNTGNGGINVDGRLSEGVLTNSDILPIDPVASPTCGVTINNIASLHAAARMGLIYLNVHSEAFPPGVVRGQLFGVVKNPGVPDHTHIYLTGKGKGHNNTSAETSEPVEP